MSLLNRILFFSLLTVLLSCAPHKKDYRNKKQASERLFNAALFDLFSKTIEEYKQVVETLKEEKDIYNEMISLSYEANRIHNEIVERQELGLLALEKLEMHIIDLEEMLFNTAAPLPEEIVEKIDAIWLDLQTMKDLINGEEMDDVEIDIMEGLEDYTDFLEMEYDSEAVFSDEEIGSDLASEPAEDSEAVSSDEEVGLDIESATASDSAEDSEAVSSDEVGSDVESAAVSESAEDSEAVSSDEVGSDTEDVAESESVEELEAVSSDEEVRSDVESAAASESAEESEAVSSDEEVRSDVESAAESESAEELEAVSSDEEVGSDTESAAESEPAEESEAFSE